MRNVMSYSNMLLIYVLLSVFIQISLCQENKTCDPATESCATNAATTTTTITTTKASRAQAPTTTIRTNSVTTSKTTQAPTTTIRTNSATTSKTTQAPTTTVRTTTATTTKTTQAPTTTIRTTSATTSKTTQAPTTTVRTTTTTTKKTQAPSGNEVEIKQEVKGPESPYAGGYDKFTVFAKCCWELRLMYFWECDLWLRHCCMDSNITDYRPVCSSTGPGYIRWWKPYRRIFYNECAATKYLCESLPPLTLPWKCMWRRDADHPHCRGNNKDVIRETKPPVLNCARYGLDSKKSFNEITPGEIYYYKHKFDEAAPEWRRSYPEITLERCGEYERPKDPEPLLPFPPTTAPPLPTPPKFEYQELKSRIRSGSLNNADTTAKPTSQATGSFPASAVNPPAMDLRTPWYGMSLWSVLLGVLTILFVVGSFVFSLWIGTKAQPRESST